MPSTRLLLFLLILFSCNGGHHTNQSNIPVVAFIDAFEDNTLKQARQGFWDALSKQGFSENKKSIRVIYRNAQGDNTALLQALNFIISQQPTLIATCPSISTISALQQEKKIPVFMMVAPEPSLMKLTDEAGRTPPNLFGVGENLQYIDTSFLLMARLVKPKQTTLRIGMIYNQAEPQSVESIQRIEALARQYQIELIRLSVTTSADAKLTTEAVLQKKVDAFFANPDNIVFAAFESILQSCNSRNVPIFTSEAGLVERGAVAAYGADLYQWGFQAGEQAAEYLKTRSTQNLHWSLPTIRKYVYNESQAKRFSLSFPAYFERIDQPANTKTDSTSTPFFVGILLITLCLTPLVLGIYLSMNVFNIPDITTDGSYTLGAACTAVLMSTTNLPLVLILLISMVAGLLAGSITAFIHTRFRIDALLSGILVMTALYSVNLTILGRSNQPIGNRTTLFESIPITGHPVFDATLVAALLITLLLTTTWYLLRSDLGIAMRATGNNPSMTTALGINNNRIKIGGLALANGLTALSGHLMAQYAGYADISMGIGIVITGLGSVLIGNTLHRTLGLRGLFLQLLLVFAGCLIFEAVLGYSLSLGADPAWLKGITALFVFGIVAVSGFTSKNNRA
ncbi:MAG: ABC transporter substrate binding protein [Ferruginibacter sp.]